MSYRIKQFVSGALVSGALMMVSGAAHAATYRWVGPDNAAWNNASNWLPQGIPGVGDDVFIGGKKKVAVPADATVANLFVGAGAEIKNSGKLKVTGKTDSSGLFTGTGTLNVPVGATADIDVDQSSSLAATTGSTAPAIVFAPITNSGRVTAKVSRGCRVDFASVQNSGSIDVVSEGTVTFKDIKNSNDLNVNVSGTLTLAKVENTSGGELSITAPNSSTPIFPTMTLLTRGGRIPRGKGDQADPSVVHLDEVINRSKGKLKLEGVINGRMFRSKSIRNEGEMQLSGARTLIEADVVNIAGATLTIDSGTTIFPSDTSAPKLNNAGKLLKPAGSDATLNVELANTGQMLIENGALHVRVPAGKACKQTGGTTTFEGGTLSVEDATGTTSDGTFEVAGGMLNGIGTIEGNLKNSGGHIKPGHSPGSITINGNFTQMAGGVLDMEVGGTTPGVSYDQMLINGTAYLGGALDVVRWAGFVPNDGDVYILFEYYAKVGNFSTFVDVLPVPGVSYATTLTPSTYELWCYRDGSADGAPPVASITSPVNGSGARSVTLTSGTASDAGGISKVTCRFYCYANPVTGVPAGFWAGGGAWTATAGPANELLATGTTSWTFPLPVGLDPGRYSLRATATDTSGNTGSSATVAFFIDPNPPSVLTITAPLNGSTLSSLSTLNGTASDAADGVGLSNVKGQLRRQSDGLYWNGTMWASPAYAFTTTLSGVNWGRNTNLPSGANLLPGAYSFTATATDKAGNIRVLSSYFSIAISGGDAPPTRNIGSGAGS